MRYCTTLNYTICPKCNEPIRFNVEAKIRTPVYTFDKTIQFTGEPEIMEIEINNTKTISELFKKVLDDIAPTLHNGISIKKIVWEIKSRHNVDKSYAHFLAQRIIAHSHMYTEDGVFFYFL